MAEMGQRHRESLYELMTCANIAISQLQARADRLDAELARIRGKRVAADMLDVGRIEKKERIEGEMAGKMGAKESKTH
jgi:hypothetical protein